jgi:tRNA U34 5-methylaminomethyl-2-thiouridine-forming methyltransferase MnmC
MVKRKLIRTKDGSHSLFQEDLNEHYHSIHGAIQESKHVFIKMGLHCFQRMSLNILEIGFGTGLNALLTCLECDDKQYFVYYHAIEKFPLSNELISHLNYSELIGGQASVIFSGIHQAPWDEERDITPHFTLLKQQVDFNQLKTTRRYDLVFFDAFAPDKQPEMWRSSNFQLLYSSLNVGGVLVTYSAKGEIKRKMEAVGFRVEKVPGPPGKREMLRAIRET